MEVNFLFDTFQFNFILFFVLLAIAYMLSRFVGFKSIVSVLALHSVLLVIFVIIGIIDYLFLIFAIFEIIFLFKIEKSGVDSIESN